MEEHSHAPERTIALGEKAGRICFALVIAWMVQGGIAIVYENNVAVELVGWMLDVGVLVSYVYMLLGVRALASKVADARLVKHTQAVILVSVIGWFALTVPPLIFEYQAQLGLLMLAVSVVIAVALGMIAIRMGDDFTRLQGHFGQLGVQAARWQKISGYLMVSVILAFIGVLVSFIADYYLWRLLKQHIGQ